MLEKNKRFILIILTHLNETLIILALTYIVIVINACSPLAIVKAAQMLLGEYSGYCVAGVAFCIIINTMIPAMKVSANQINKLAKYTFYWSLLLAAVLILIFSILGLNVLLRIISITGLLIAVYVIYTAYYLYISTKKQQQ